MRHKIACRRVLEIGKRKFLQMRQQVVAEIKFHMAGCNDDGLPCEESKKSRYKRR